MLAHVAQVTRTYRTHIMWHSEEEAWKRRSRPARLLTSGSLPPEPARQSGFDPLVQLAVQRLSDMMDTARQLKDISESLLPGSFAQTGSEEQYHDSQVPLEQLKELVAGYNQLYRASDDSFGTINDHAAKAVIGELPAEALERLQQLGVSPGSDGSLQLDPLLLEKAPPARYEAQAIAGVYGIAAAISVAADRLLALPPGQLLNRSEPPLQAFSKYRHRRWNDTAIYTYFPVPLTGFLLNRYL